MKLLRLFLVELVLFLLKLRSVVGGVVKTVFGRIRSVFVEIKVCCL